MKIKKHQTIKMEQGGIETPGVNLKVQPAGKTLQMSVLLSGLLAKSAARTLGTRPERRFVFFSSKRGDPTWDGKDGDILGLVGSID